MVKFDVQTLTYVLGVLIPLLTRAVSKELSHEGFKAVVNLGLTAVAGGVAIAIEANGNVTFALWVKSIGGAWFASIVSYYGLWKPTAIADLVGRLTQRFGIGREYYQYGEVLDFTYTSTTGNGHGPISE